MFEEFSGQEHLKRISGTDLRGRIKLGSDIPEWVIRDVVQDIIHSMKRENQSIFFE